VRLQTLRIIDANCNRIAEGLRLLEDVARFALDDAETTRQLKTMRHSLVTNLSRFGTDLLSARDSDVDVGRDTSIGRKQDLAALVRANSKRVAEALRVVEELANLPDLEAEVNPKDFEKARFSLYLLERKLISKLTREQKTKRLKGLYVIIDSEVLGLRNEVEVARRVIGGGARVIQLRSKHSNKRELLTTALKLRDLCHKAKTLFIVNDYLDIALACDADGLHIGQDDLPLPAVRPQLPIDKIVGVSVTTLTQARKAQAEMADYMAVGPIFRSPTKTRATVVGLERLRQIKQAISVPVIAIGGVSIDNISEILAAGADSVAVISAVLHREDVEAATREIVREIEKETKAHK
jgi:thiamine-phosphate pyrophosphorylase